nr:translocation/assembly module TamB domain-containing protein [Lautropia sp.]
AVPEPGLIDERLQGRLSLDGELAGAFDRLQAKVELKGERLGLDHGALQIASIDVRASGPAAAVVPPQAALDVALRMKGVVAAGRRIDALELLANGTLANHRFRLSAAGEGQAAKLNGEGQAVLQGAPSWRARLAGLELDGRVPVKLTAPASLRVDGGGLQLDRFNLAVAGGEAGLERLHLRWSEQLSFSTLGSARDLPVMELLKIASPTPATGSGKGAAPKAGGDALNALAGLRLEGNWNLAGSGAADLTGEARLGLREEGAAALGLEGDNGVRVVLKNGRLDGTFDLRLPSLAFTHPLTEPDFVVDGRLRLAGSVAGTVTAPQWNANLTGETLSVLQRSVGWRLTDGVLSARFEGRKFELQALKLQAGDGSVELRGQARLLDAPRPAAGAVKAGGAGRAAGAREATTLPFDGRFELTASRFPVPIGPGQRVALSGTTTLASGADGLSLRGKLKVDQGIIEIQGSSAPALPADVKLVYQDEGGRETAGRAGPGAPAQGAGRAAGQAGPAKNAKGGGAESKGTLRIQTDLAVDLGDRLRVTGNGIAARLTGSLQVLGTLPDNPQLIGVVNIVEGSYQSYGQNLRIEKGLIRFNGPIDNPALDLVAKRPFLPVEVGVSVTGTALNPRISLVSKPDMSETDKLAWLVLGTDPSNAPSAAQTLALREAAKSLLVRGDGSHRPGIGERLGLDVMNFGYGSNTGPTQGVTESKNPTGLPGGQNASASAAQQEVVTLGKRIGSRLFVSYEQGVRGLYNLLRIQYALSQRLSLRAQSGSDNAVDVLYSYSFD